jgi:hypothetical protein
MELIKSFIERRIKMDEEIRKMLEEEIKTEIRDLSTLEPGSKEKSTAIEDLAKLYRLRIEETRNEWDFNEKYESRDSDMQLKKDQLEEQVKDRYFRLGVEVASIILPLIFYAAWMKRGFKFEKLELIPLRHFEDLFNRFKPTKK